MTHLETWVVTAAGIVGALAIIGSALRRLVRGLVRFVQLVQDLLDLQPKVIHLAEELTAQTTWRQDFDRRLSALETPSCP